MTLAEQGIVLFEQRRLKSFEEFIGSKGGGGGGGRYNLS